MAKLNVNGKVRDVQVEADTPLLWVIREQVGLTGTKYGCGVAQCGACSVHINGELVRSCALPVGGVKATDKIVTIEGLSAAGSGPIHAPVRNAIIVHNTFLGGVNVTGVMNSKSPVSRSPSAP